MADTDILGAALTPVEQEALRAYDMLKQLAARRMALACLWQVTNDLDLQFEQLYDLGV